MWRPIIKSESFPRDEFFMLRQSSVWNRILRKDKRARQDFLKRYIKDQIRVLIPQELNRRVYPSFSAPEF